MSQPAVTVLRDAFQSAHEWLEGTVDDMDNTVANYVPPGLTAKAGAHYVHHVSAEDMFLNHLRGAQPLMAGSYAGRIGTSEPPPMGDWSAWGRSVEVDMPAAREYAKAVYAATDDYLSTLTDDDLQRPAGLGDFGFPDMSLGRFLGGMILINTGAHCGEISTIKGLQGRKGYPF
jgi:hypothetical protein